ncbi:MAG: TRAP transporter small permease subunit [Desulfobacteraceae bacterium]|jgi:TRAP-type mannitol/chloroaromatic compound transport system permease small subunit|nr:MAG: TRAP transporter small permease subunit [Desulfobacteraceae bacterium]
MQKFIRIVDSINDFLGKVAAFLMVPLVLITAYEVIMRYVVKRPTIWAWDLNTQVFAAIAMLGGGYTLMQKGHVVVDVFVIKMDPRKRALLDIFTSLFFFGGVIVLLAGGWEMAWMSIKANETMPTVWAPPFYTMKLLVPVGAFFLLLQGVSEFLKNILLIFKKQT